jgi:hypothetical protein
MRHRTYGGVRGRRGAPPPTRFPNHRQTISEHRLGRDAQQTIPVGLRFASLRFAQHQPTFYLAQPTALD